MDGRGATIWDAPMRGVQTTGSPVGILAMDMASGGSRSLHDRGGLHIHDHADRAAKSTPFELKFRLDGGAR